MGICWMRYVLDLSDAKMYRWTINKNLTFSNTRSFYPLAQDGNPYIFDDDLLSDEEGEGGEGGEEL